jgi:hypothetical protein
LDALISEETKSLLMQLKEKWSDISEEKWNNIEKENTFMGALCEDDAD